MPQAKVSAQQNFFLPDFCAGRAAFAIVLIVELVALLMSLARQSLHDRFWLDLATASIFLLWIGLLCVTALCRARPWMARMTTSKASLLSLALIGIIVALVSEATFLLGRYLSGGIPGALEMFPSKHAG